MAPKGKQKRNDQNLALAIATGSSVREAAKATGFGERTAHRRLEDAEFLARVEAIRATIRDRAIGQVTDAVTRAVRKLEELLSAESETVQLGAARTLIDAYAKLGKPDDDKPVRFGVNGRLSGVTGRRGMHAVNESSHRGAESLEETWAPFRALRRSGISLDYIVDEYFGDEPVTTGAGPDGDKPPQIEGPKQPQLKSNQPKEHRDHLEDLRRKMRGASSPDVINPRYRG